MGWVICIPDNFRKPEISSFLRPTECCYLHYSDIMMSATASQITGVSIVCSAVRWGADQRKHQRSASLAFVRTIHQWPVDSPHKSPVTRKMFPFYDVIMGLHGQKGKQSFFVHKVNVLCKFHDIWMKYPGYSTIYYASPLNNMRLINIWNSKAVSAKPLCTSTSLEFPIDRWLHVYIHKWINISNAHTCLFICFVF